MRAVLGLRTGPSAARSHGTIDRDLTATGPLRSGYRLDGAQALGDPPQRGDATLDFGAAHGVARLHRAGELTPVPSTAEDMPLAP